MKEAEKANEAARATGDSLALRFLSSIVLVPIVITSIHFGGRIFAGVVAFAAMVMIFEWTRMVERREFSAAFYILAASTALALFAAAAGRYEAAWIICVAGAAGSYGAARRMGPGAAWPAFAAFYIAMPSVALLWLRLDAPNGMALTYLLFVVVWAGDVGAYTFGKLVGGPKVNPYLSPAKTWAGIIGGVIAGGIAGAAITQWFVGGALVPSLLVGGSLGGASVLGDMAESAFKRRFGVKDISGFIPGHGGALDRMDGMIFATTAMTAVLFAYMVAARIQG